MKGKPGPARRNPTTGKVSMQVGIDRVMAWRNRADSHYNDIGVSHHDHTRPILSIIPLPKREMSFNLGLSRQRVHSRY